MPPDKTIRLSAAQRDMLARFTVYTYGQGHVHPAGRRTAYILERHGLLRSVGGNWYEITKAGRESVALSEDRDG